MARLNRLCPVDTPQHIIQLGNNREFFNGNEDIEVYAIWLKEFVENYKLQNHE